MNTEELLEKIGKLLEAEREHTKKLVETSEKRLKRQLKKMESAIVLHFDNRVGDHENASVALRSSRTIPPELELTPSCSKIAVLLRFFFQLKNFVGHFLQRLYHADL